jgi:hypothetical protein
VWSPFWENGNGIKFELFSFSHNLTSSSWGRTGRLPSRDCLSHISRPALRKYDEETKMSTIDASKCIRRKSSSSSYIYFLFPLTTNFSMYSLIVTTMLKQASKGWIKPSGDKSEKKTTTFLERNDFSCRMTNWIQKRSKKDPEKKGKKKQRTCRMIQTADRNQATGHTTKIKRTNQMKEYTNLPMMTADGERCYGISLHTSGSSSLCKVRIGLAAHYSLAGN